MKNSSQFFKGVFNEYMNFGSNGRNGCTLIVKKKIKNEQSIIKTFADRFYIDRRIYELWHDYGANVVDRDSFHNVLSEKRMIFSGYCLSCTCFTAKVVAASHLQPHWEIPHRERTERQHTGQRLWMLHWVVNICATFSRWIPLSCFPVFARSWSVFRWT